MSLLEKDKDSISEQIIEIGKKFVEATKEDENKWLVALAAASYAGHLIGGGCPEEHKKDEIDRALRLLKAIAEKDCYELGMIYGKLNGTNETMDQG